MDSASSPARLSQSLRFKIRLTSRGLLEASRAIWQHSRVAELFPDLLFQVHSTMRASVPLMEAALERSRALARSSDPVARPLCDYLAEHIPEERDHDEWLLDDMEVLGLDRSQVLGRVPSPTVAALSGMQYYWIFHYHPVALLGYIAVLEGDPPRPEELERVVQRTGLPRDAFRTYFKHSHLDLHHSRDLDQVLDALPLNEGQAALIGLNAARTAHLLARALEEVLARHESGAA